VPELLKSQFDFTLTAKPDVELSKVEKAADEELQKFLKNGPTEAELQLAKAETAILDGEVILYPGEKRDGLLVYRTLDPRAKRYHVEVTATLTSGEPFQFTAHYKKRKP
jgi:vacuolar-type H+-ATPase subunit E/Vma4